MTSLKESNLLVVTNKFPHAKDQVSSSFVKNQLEFIKGHFKKIYVIALSPWVPKVLSRFSFMDSKGRWDGYAQDYRYDNVEVYFPKPIAFPTSGSRKRRGEDAFKSADKVIRKRELSFDLIHAHFTDYAGYVGARLKDRYGTPLILTAHEDRDTFLSEVSSGNEKLLYAWRNADRIIRVNGRDLGKLEQLGIEKSRLLHIPNGFSSESFRPADREEARASLGLPSNKKILLNAAALEEYKGQRYLIESMKIAADSRDDLALYIIGKGRLRRELRALIESYSLQDKIILAGSDKPAGELAQWMNACDLFVLPSLSESFGIVQLEAMACGKPVIATFNGGSEEIITDDRLGILVEPKDVQGLADAIIRGLNSQWNEEYILDYVQKFTWKEIAERILETYQELISNGSGYVL